MVLSVAHWNAWDDNLYYGMRMEDQIEHASSKHHVFTF